VRIRQYRRQTGLIIFAPLLLSKPAARKRSKQNLPQNPRSQIWHDPCIEQTVLFYMPPGEPAPPPGGHG
jgi:hypothetical protein